MNCEEGAKIYCKHSWVNGGYTSEAHCLEDIDAHECGELPIKRPWPTLLGYAITQPMFWGGVIVAVGVVVVIVKYVKGRKTKLKIDGFTE